MAQVLTFATTFLPILFGLVDSLIFLVQATAIASILISVASFGSQAVLPNAVSADEILSELMAELRFLFGCCLAVPLFGLLALPWIDIRLLLLATSAILLAQGLYVIAGSISVRIGDFQSMMAMRFAYAVSGFVGAGLLCFIGAPGFAFALAVAVSFTVGVLAWALRLRRKIVSGWKRWRMRRPELRLWLRLFDRRYLLVGYLLGGFATQLPAVLLPAFGPLAGPWAVVVRVSSGVQTIALQLIAPAVDIASSEALRQRSRPRLLAAIRRGLLAGVFLGASTLVGVVALLPLMQLGHVDVYAWVAFWAGVLGFAVGGSVVGPISRTLAILGGFSEQLWWNLGRASVAGGALILLPPEGGFFVLGVAGVAASVLYVLLCFARARDWDEEGVFPASGSGGP